MPSVVRSTNAVKLHHLADVNSNEKMKYCDFTSLYPRVNNNGKYAMGHREIISQPKTTDSSELSSPSALDSP